MTPTIDDLLADARIPVTGGQGFDVAAALRRLGADTTPAPVPEVEQATQAGQRLSVICRWVLNAPDAAQHMSRIAEDAERTPPPADQSDVDGALVFACLLHLTGHPESAEFWWQLAAGAGSRAAAYCLHLHHLQLGEPTEAHHWYHQLTHSFMTDTVPPDAEFLEGLEAFARYVRANGSSALPPTGRLESEVDRLASRTSEPSVIVCQPDRQLVVQLEEFTARR